MKAFFLHALPSRFKTMMWQYFWNHDVWIRMNWKNYTDFGTPFSPLVSSDQGAYSSDMSGWTLDSTQDDLCPSYKSTGNFWLGRQWQFHLWHIGTISFLVNKLAKKGQKIWRGKLFWECSPPPSQPSGDHNRLSGGPSGQTDTNRIEIWKCDQPTRVS